MVDHTVQNLPPKILQGLTDALAQLPSDTEILAPEVVEKVLIGSIEDFDNAMLSELLEVFPGGPDEIEKLLNAEIAAVTNTPHNLPKVVRGMKGTTALISLVDPSGENLWVASLGDCQAGESALIFFCLSVHGKPVLLSPWHSTAGWSMGCISSECTSQWK